MKNKIINYAKGIDIDDIGFTNVSKILDRVTINSDVPFINNSKMLDLNKYDTVISIVMGYPHNCEQLKNIKKEEVYFSSSSWGMDYHIVLKDKLSKLASYIGENIDNFEYMILVDDHCYDDRYIAYSSGLGFYGKNNLLINDKLGSFIFIGNMLTNLHITGNNPSVNHCLECDKCIKACPTKALCNDGYDYRKCLSFLTQKKDISVEETLNFNNCIYGCDICAKVCPYNKKNNQSKYFNVSGVEFINVNNYKKLSNKEFKCKYGHLSGSWRGKKIIERNINIYKDKIN